MKASEKKRVNQVKRWKRERGPHERKQGKRDKEEKKGIKTLTLNSAK